MRTKETSLLIPEGKTTKEKYDILNIRQAKSKPHHNHHWASIIGEGNPYLKERNNYHFKIVCFRDKIEIYR